MEALVAERALSRFKRRNENRGSYYVEVESEDRLGSKKSDIWTVSLEFNFCK